MTPEQRNIAAIVSKLLRWFSANARDLPWRRTRDPYAIWVSEIMLQQTQVKTVIPYYERWMTELPDVRALAGATTRNLHKLWEGLGYYTRVRNMQAAARQILELHSGVFPRRYEDILALPGVGRYTAGAVASIAFNEPRPVLDGNVARVLTRVLGLEGDPREKEVNARLWATAEEIIVCAKAQRVARARRKNSESLGPCSAVNQALMELGALVCTPRNPRCAQCPISTRCTALKTGRVEELPWRNARPRLLRRHVVAVVWEHNGRWLAQERPSGAVNAHLWEFPSIEIPSDRRPTLSPERGSRHKAVVALTHLACKARLRECRHASSRGTPSLAFLAALLRKSASELTHCCTLRHTITRSAITLDVIRTKETGQRRFSALPGKWLTSGQLRELPFAAAHRKIVDRLLGAWVGSGGPDPATGSKNGRKEIRAPHPA